MNVVVDIPEAKWKVIQDGYYCGILDAYMYDAIKNAIPLENVIMEHYRQGRADERAYQRGELMQTFNPDVEEVVG